MPYVIMQDEVTCMEIKIKSTLDNTDSFLCFIKQKGKRNGRFLWDFTPGVITVIIR